MKLEYYKEFCVLAESGDWKKAAKELGMPISRLKRHIENAEHDLGVKLVDETSGNLRLTRAGVYFITEAPLLAGRYEDLLSHVTQAKEQESKTLRIGYMRSAAYPLLEPLCKFLESKHPSMKLVFCTGDIRSLRHMLTKRKVDAIIVMDLDPVFRKTCNVIPLYEEGIGVAVSLDSPLCDCSALSFADLDSIPLYAPESDIVPELLDHIKRNLLSRRSHESVEILKDTESVFDLVEAGSGVCVSAQHNAEYYEGRFAMVPLCSQDQFSFPVSLMWLKCTDNEYTFTDKAVALSTCGKHLAKKPILKEVWK